MTFRTVLQLLLLTAISCTAGCFWRHKVAPAPTSQAFGAAVPHLQNSPLDPPSDPHPKVKVVTRLDVYVLTIPYGTVSLDDAFWKDIDERSLPPDTYDVLYRNGIRVGRAPTADWEHFRQMIIQYPAVTQQGDYASEEGKSIEMAMKKNVQGQSIFYVDASHQLQGRTYDRCDDLFSMTFYPSPRLPGGVRVAMVPLVRSRNFRMEYNAQNVGNEVEYVSPERFYDLNLKADIPADHFLIIAPSREGRWPTSIGSVFLTADGTAEQLERVILLVPRVVTLHQISG